METKLYETPDCYKDARGNWSLTLKSGKSITIRVDDTIKITPRASNSVKIEAE
jgi:hypothetical protein